MAKIYRKRTVRNYPKNRRPYKPYMADKNFKWLDVFKEIDALKAKGSRKFILSISRQRGILYDTLKHNYYLC